MKKCKRCGEEKPLDQFYRHPATADRLFTKCKECAKRDDAQNHQRKLQNNLYPQKPCEQCGKMFGVKPSELKRGYGRFCCRQCEYDWMSIVRLAPDGGAQRRANKNAMRRMRRRDPVLRLIEVSRNRVRKAIKSGKLVRGPCAVCGKTPGQAHHEDYSKPLEVIWLCSLHHRRADIQCGSRTK